MTGQIAPHSDAARWRSRIDIPTLLVLAMTALGLWLRIEHAMTFDGVRRGSDYNVHIAGVRWMLEHKRPFFFTPDLSEQVGYQAPLWYALGAVVLAITGSERAIAGIAVVGWLIRQLLLGRMLYVASDTRDRKGLFGWGAVAALALHAVIPLSVLTDGKLNPEGLNSTCFMLACYPLFIMERAAASEHRITWSSALFFGALAGIALLTKATGIVLWFGAAVLIAWQALRIARKLGFASLLRRVVLPIGAAFVLFALVSSVWVGPNIRKFGHPFPHAWVDIPQAEPLLYRRPLGWALPFDWAPYLKFPVIRSAVEPRPNFWASVITGTWSDWYNRGLCRLQGEGKPHDRVWGYHDPAWGGSFWGVSKRCITLHRRVLSVGLVLTLGMLIAVFAVVRAHVSSDGRRGSLVLPALVVMEVAFVMLFALTYPFDWAAVLNPRYLLSAAAPMCACLGLALMQHRGTPVLRAAAHAVVLIAVAAVAGLVVFERFGS